jgi:DNA-binding GntR family transcriptional regulator
MATHTKAMASEKPARGSKGTGSSTAYKALRSRIVSLEMRPGEDIDEQSLVDEFGISRTPLREAMIRLAAEGLITLLPNRGARVASMELPQIQEHLEAFEGFVVAFEQAQAAGDTNSMIDTNWDLHNAIGQASGNRVLAKIYAGLLTEDLRIARLAMSYESFASSAAYDSHVGSILSEHRQLLAAIAESDADGADKLAASHTNLARTRVADFISSSGITGLLIGSLGAINRREHENV